MHPRRNSDHRKLWGFPGILAGSLATVFLANACAEVASNEAANGVDRIVAVQTDSATAAECAALLTMRSDGEARCGGEAGCAALGVRPDDSYSWLLWFQDATTRACAEAYLRAEGLDPTGDGISLRLVARRDALAEILRLVRLDSYSVDCADPETCCSDLSTCVTNPLCRPIVARPASLQGACQGAEETIGCSTSRYVTGDSYCWGIDPAGECWLVQECEVPADWSAYDHESLLVEGPPEVRALCPAPPAVGGVIQIPPTLPPCEP